MNQRWICNDVWMDIFPSFDRPQLGLKLAILSQRFNALVDRHFNGKSELTIWRTIGISRGIGAKPKLSVRMDGKFLEFLWPDYSLDSKIHIEEFSLPDRPLPSKIRFKRFQIDYIDHSVIAFLRLNHQIFDKRGTNLQLSIPSSHTTNGQPIWDVFVREIWPIFSANICHLGFSRGDHLDNLRLRTLSTILTDLLNLNSIDLRCLLPEAIAISDDFDGQNATISAGQMLSKWLHSPRKDGQPKQLRCEDYKKQTNFDWVNNFNEQFLRANAISSVSYQIRFSVHAPSMQIVPFELVNEWTKEKLTLAKAKKNEWNNWIMKRCKIIGETAAVHWEDGNWDNNCNNVLIRLFSCANCIGPLSPPSEEKEEAGQSITKRRNE